LECGIGPLRQNIRSTVAQRATIRIIARPDRGKSIAGVQDVIPALQADVAIFCELQQLNSIGGTLRQVGVDLLAVTAMRMKGVPSDPMQFGGDQAEGRPVVGIAAQLGLDEPASTDKTNVTVGVSAVLLARCDPMSAPRDFRAFAHTAELRM